MREHDAFRRAGGAGSETHKRRVRDARRERRLGIFQPRETQTICAGIFQRDGFAGMRQRRCRRRESRTTAPVASMSANSSGFIW